MKAGWIFAAALGVLAATVACGGTRKPEFEQLQGDVAALDQKLKSHESNIDTKLAEGARRIDRTTKNMEDEILPELARKLKTIKDQLDKVVDPESMRMILECEKLVKDLTTYQKDTTARMAKIDARADKGNAKLLGSLETQQKHIDAHITELKAMIDKLNK